ncbi:MAG TPA: DUF938 domain-containing protein [Aliiroseovarius sp.]|nr:DUF938 domain-containing protein [Aliiroseovarius sp.]
MTQPGERPRVHSNAEGLGDGRLSAPSALRNIGPICEALAQVVPAAGTALEIASGTGQHAVAFAAAFPGVTWQPTDIAPERLVSINAWRQAEGAPANLRPARHLDASRPGWPDWPGEEDGSCAPVDLVVAVNLFHLIDNAAARMVLTGAAKVLKPGGKLFIYGPFRDAGGFRSEGDRKFHASIVAAAPKSGYKQVDWMRDQARLAGLEWLGRVEMPANNLSLIWQKPGGGDDDGEKVEGAR